MVSPIQNQPIEIRQRIPLSVDPISEAAQALPAAEALTLVTARTDAISHLYTGMQQLHTNVAHIMETLAATIAPAQLIAGLIQPDGTAGRLLHVQFDPSSLGNASPTVTVLTDDTGWFRLPLPKNMILKPTGNLSLLIHGATSNIAVQVPYAQIAANGLAGAIVLPQFLTPLPVSILAALEALAPPPAITDGPVLSTNPSQLPVVRVGEDDSLLAYGSNSSVDAFPYGVFFRLIEPRASILSKVQAVPLGTGSTFLPHYATAVDAQTPVAILGGRTPAPRPDPAGGVVAYVDRLPVEQPISVDGFRDQMMGLQPNGTYTSDETRPMAGTLGLGYVLWLSQRWTLQGLALGNLVYSLPLAPGEQQQVAIFERVDTARVSESEFFSEAQSQEQQALADTSTKATFDSAFSESVKGSSHFDSGSTSGSWGASIIIASGGGGSSSSSGNSSQSLEGQRNTTQQAAQSTHSSAENQAAARRSAHRTGMRLASASESEAVTTKVITNHNHTRALTMQYWEVERLYDVTCAIDGLTLTVLVPLQVVRFMPPGQPATLTQPGQVASRSQVIARYSTLIKHSDVLAQALPRRFQQGLALLTQFAADPSADVGTVGGAAESVISLTLSGTFLYCEDIFVTAVTDRGTRVGPVKLANTATEPPTAATGPAQAFSSRDQLVGWLTRERQGAVANFTGALALPTSMNRANVVGFEISRTFRQVSYTLISSAQSELQALQAMFGSSTNWWNQALLSALYPGASAPTTVFLNPTDLEKILRGPQLSAFIAEIEEVDVSGNLIGTPSEAYANESLSGVELTQQPFPIPAMQLAPVLRYNEILEIERMAQHVVRSTLAYSRAVWASMSADERAILLEAYTIGVPSGGVKDATQMIPLLNCVENRVLGYFGNCLILPFFIPQILAESGGFDPSKVDPAKIEESLLAYQRASFRPPHSTIALPTRGVLGEAVLGHSVSAEKIDLTRFWNWQDSPADTAPTISPVVLPTATGSIATGLTAPNSLTTLPSLINNVLNAPAPDSTLLQALSKDAASQQDFAAGLTGASLLAPLVQNAQTTANAARADALQTTKQLTGQAMATIGDIYGGIYAGNPNAGSNAAKAVSGSAAGSTPASPAGGGLVPGQPTNVTATAGAKQAVVAFTPGNIGGSPIKSYTVTPTPDPDPKVTHTGQGSPITVKGLATGTSYTFTVHATNSAGDSPESDASAPVTPT